jgi:hypothetical protein
MDTARRHRGGRQQLIAVLHQHRSIQAGPWTRPSVRICEPQLICFPYLKIWSTGVPVIIFKETADRRTKKGDNIYKILFYFDKIYAVMDEAEHRHLMESLIDEIQIYEERQPNGQWLKSIRFILPIIDEDMSLSLDNDSRIETVMEGMVDL